MQFKENTSNTLINMYETLQLQCQAANRFVVREWTDMEKCNPVLKCRQTYVVSALQWF